MFSLSLTDESFRQQQHACERGDEIPLFFTVLVFVLMEAR